MKRAHVIFIGILIIFSIFTYGFVDTHMPSPPLPLLQSMRVAVVQWVLFHRAQAAVLYTSVILCLFGLYSIVLRCKKTEPARKSLIIIVLLGVLSYSAFSYDVFNYIITAKVAYLYKENPYVVMPVEIQNEPNLSFTRASNKVALYGPVWILFTFLPHTLSLGNPWLAMYAFKLAAALLLAVMVLLIRKETGSSWNAYFFALNPLVLVEVLSSGHNDIFMMVLAIAGGILKYDKRRFLSVAGVLLVIASVFVKGATLTLLPVLFIAKTKDLFFRFGFWTMLAVFFITPLREELYPWYAVWFLSFASFLSPKKYRPLQWFCIWFSSGLLLRHAPYIYTGVYEGTSALLRTGVTVLMPGLYFLIAIRKLLHRHANS